MAALWLLHFVPQAHAEPLTFGIVPQQSAARLAATWGPLLEAIGTKTGIALDFRTAPDIPTFERRLAVGEYDIAYMNPYHYTVFHDAPGYVAIAKEKNRKIQGIVVVSADSAIRGLEHLDGTTVAFPAPAAFAASVLPRAALRQRSIAIEPKYVASHDSVYMAVADGLFPAGGGIMRTLEAAPLDIRSRVRVLWRTEMFTPHAITVHPRVPSETASRLVAAMVALSDTEQGRTLLSVIGFTGIEAAEDSGWNDIRALGITPAEAGGL